MYGIIKLKSISGLHWGAIGALFVIPVAFVLSWSIARQEISSQFSHTLSAIDSVRGFQGLVLDGGGVSQLAINLSERTSDWYIWKFQAKENAKAGQEIDRVFSPGSGYGPRIWPFSVPIQGTVAGYLLNVVLLPPASLLIKLALISLFMGAFCAGCIVAWFQWHERSIQLAIANTVRGLAIQVAHDIRSPLSAFKVVSTSQSLPLEIRDLAGMAIERMLHIVDSISLKRLEETASLRDAIAPLDLSPASIKALLQDSIREKETEFSTGPFVGLKFQSESSSDGALVHVSSSEFKRIISNLLNNALEAGSDLRPVEIGLRTHEQSAVIDIVDHGSGISPDILRTLGKTPISRGKRNGSGLGLYHAFRAVKQWKGTVRIERAEERGTRVTIRLPLKESRIN